MPETTEGSEKKDFVAPKEMTWEEKELSMHRVADVDQAQEMAKAGTQRRSSAAQARKELDTLRALGIEENHPQVQERIMDSENNDEEAAGIENYKGNAFDAKKWADGLDDKEARASLSDVQERIDRIESQMKIWSDRGMLEGNVWNKEFKKLQQDLPQQLIIEEALRNRLGMGGEK